MKLAMRGRLAQCLLLSFRTPEDQARDLLPRGLKLTTLSGWAFWNVVLCRVDNMRPVAFPRGLGITYHHAACRLLAEAEPASGGGAGPLRGLYFIRSDADAPVLSAMGNCLTHFRFHDAAIRLDATETSGIATAEVLSADGKGDMSLKAATAPESGLLPGSIFSSPAERNAFLKYQPLALAPMEDGQSVELAEVMRDETDWKEEELTIHQFTSTLLAPYEIHLELATKVAPLDYRWKLGRKMAIKGDSGFHARRLTRAMEECFQL
jgi:hypothetical protein